MIKNWFYFIFQKKNAKIQGLKEQRKTSEKHANKTANHDLEVEPNKEFDTENQREGILSQEI